MFKDITWLQFFTTLLVLLIVYYGYVAVVYYRQELGLFFSGKLKRGASSATVNASVAEEELEAEEEEDSEEDTEEDAPVEVILPAAALANLSAVTKQVAAPEKSEEEDEAEETYDDGLTRPTEVGEGPVEQLEEVTDEEILSSVEEPIGSKESTSDIASDTSEEDTVNNTDNDEIIAKASTFETQQAAVVPPAIAVDVDLPEHIEDLPDNSISVTSLAYHLGQVSRGAITTPEELVSQLPNLDQTEFLMRLYTSGTDKAEKALVPRLARAEVGI